MIVIKQRGNFTKTERFLRHASEANIRGILEKYGREGVDALSAATPVDSGLTASSWGYEVSGSKGSYSIYWTNSHIVNGVPIAIIIQYGHATRNGGYVEGIEYINQALQPIFDKLAQDAWRGVTNS